MDRERDLGVEVGARSLHGRTARSRAGGRRRPGPDAGHRQRLGELPHALTGPACAAVPCAHDRALGTAPRRGVARHRRAVRRPHRRPVERADRVPGLDGVRQRRAHDRHRAHARRRATRRPAATRPRRRAARPQRHRQGERAVDRDVPRLGRREAARRVPRRHRAPARRVARDDDGRVGRGGIHARRSRSVPAVHGDPRVRLLVPRPGHPRGARPARLPRRSGRRSLARRASRRRVSATSSARRRARRPGAPWCSSSRARREIVAAISVPPEGRAVLLDDAPADADRRASPPTAARSPGSRVDVGPATDARAEGVVRVDGDTDARRPRRRQHGVHDL